MITNEQKREIKENIKTLKNNADYYGKPFLNDEKTGFVLEFENRCGIIEGRKGIFEKGNVIKIENYNLEDLENKE